ncbi:MAG: ribosome maturation factor RimP [Candidatus Zixiibacteriota bacterium]
MSGANADVESRLQSIGEAAAHSRGVELLELKYIRAGRRQIVRVIVDKVGGVTIDECADVSRRLSADLDMSDILDGRYTLEVSSPGVDRPLTTAADFRRKVGREVAVRINGDGEKEETIEGVIGQVTDDQVMIGDTPVPLKRIIEGKQIV